MMDNYQRAEAMLVNYAVLKRAKRELLQELDYINKYGLQNKSRDIILFEPKASFTVLPAELKEAFIIRIKRLIVLIDGRNATVAKALYKLKDDLYFDVIVKYYFEGLPVGKIAFNKGKSDRVILNNKKRLVQTISELIYKKTKFT